MKVETKKKGGILTTKYIRMTKDNTTTNASVIRYSFTLVVKRYKRENCTLDDMRSIYSGKTCLIAKNSKFDGLYIHKSGKIIKGKFSKVAGSVRYPILIAQDEVHIRFENFHSMPNIITDQYVKQDIISVVDLSCA
jgi:hypothetical protein